MVEAAVRRRRRGDELESALLQAAWAELAEIGYVRMTMASVAARAGTSEPVLYRRWPNKAELVFAALERHRAENPIVVPDTGALRTDLLAYLGTLGHALAGFFPIVVGASVSGLLADSGLTPAGVRERLIAAQGLPDTRLVYQRARDRGELDLDRIPAAVLAMPFDLLRQDLLLDPRPPSAARIRSIVDELFLPLVEGR